MKNPKLIVKPFAKNGQKNVIPENYETSMDSNQATWDQGFGQITMLPVAAGGLPPKGQDFNGILNQISENIVYQSQGGRFKFSPEYAESIGGYPKGAILQSDDEKKEYQSLIDNNKVNFNTESNISASWELVGVKYAIKTEVDLALMKKFDKENISGALGNDNSKVPSLNLLTTEVGKLQPKGNYQPAGDYATNGTVNSKFNEAITAAENANNNANNRVPSDRKVNNIPLSRDITLTADDVGAQQKGNYLNKDSTSDQVLKGALYANGDGIGAGNPRGLDSCLLLKTIGVDEPQIVKRESGTAPWLNFRLPKNSGRLGRENTSKSSDSGYLICGDTGLIIQWGSVTASMSQSDFRQFPISFKEGCFQIVSSYAEFGDYGMGTASYPTSKSEFIITKRTHTGVIASGTVRYIAIGY
ncbi:TPA: gp53-like domain-containing protein [Providencia alcalifaciens]